MNGPSLSNESPLYSFLLTANCTFVPFSGFTCKWPELASPGTRRKLGATELVNDLSSYSRSTWPGAESRFHDKKLKQFNFENGLKDQQKEIILQTLVQSDEVTAVGL